MRAGSPTPSRLNLVGLWSFACGLVRQTDVLTPAEPIWAGFAWMGACPLRAGRLADAAPSGPSGAAPARPRPKGGNQSPEAPPNGSPVYVVNHIMQRGVSGSARSVSSVGSLRFVEHSGYT